MAGFRGTWDALEDRARDDRRGLWADPGAVEVEEKKSLIAKRILDASFKGALMPLKLITSHHHKIER